MGPGWRGAGIDAGAPDEGESPTAAFLAWFLGLVVIYGVLFGTGEALYGRPVPATACVAVAAAAAWGVLRVLPRVGLR
jgi:hypothetical protein